jgi:lysophospholipase L1-like esterase
MKKIISYSLLAVLTAMVGCKPNLKPLEVSKGTADFTNYVAVGNSLCAGYTDGGLSKFGQENSFPRMLAQQFALAGGGEFKTPFMEATGNGNDGTDKPMYTLVIPTGATSPSPVQTGTATTISDNVSAGGLYNHLGVPGIKAIEAQIPQYGAFNKFLGRISSAAGTQSLLDLAVAKKPTFFTYWLGANDVLGWATQGGVGNVITTPFALTLANYAQTLGALTHPAMVGGSIAAQIDSLTKNGAKGAIANIPDVSSTPYFTTVPYNAAVLTRQGQVDTLNAAYAAFNSIPGLPTTSKIVWVLGANGLVIEDSAAIGFRRRATAEDFICLTALGQIQGPTAAGIATPLKDGFVLDKGEAATARTYTDQYNATIKTIADAKGLALVDANTFLKTVKSGILYNNVAVNAKFVEGGGFSLDGVHPTPRGYALLANEFIKAINAKYGSTIPNVDINKYRGVLLP